MSVLPPSKPRLSSRELLSRISRFSIDRDAYPLIVVGIRGYYRDAPGNKGVNSRKVYDDAIFIHSPQVMAAYNGNTDPSGYRRGVGRGSKKGMPTLQLGAWYAYRFGHHKGYRALCQIADEVTVMRDGIPDYPDTGYFGINIHRGGNGTPGSLGCQTIPPNQWDSFIELAKDQGRRYFGSAWERRTIPYVLLEGAGQ